MNAAERDLLVKKLQSTRDAFRQAVSGLSGAQAYFKPAPDRWSIGEIVEHVAVTEHGMFRLITHYFEPITEPEDEVSAVSLERASDRMRMPIQAPERTRPRGRFGGLSGALTQFLANRERSIEYVRNCQDDLRMRIVTHPVGRVNGRDCLHILIDHPLRHLEQINEVKAADGYPS
jgi:hypothetical protein